MDRLNGVFTYKGDFVSIEEATKQGIFRLGDVIVVGGDTYVFTDDGFSKASTVENLGYAEFEDDVSIPPTSATLIEQKCNCCGAPLMVSKYSHSVKCEYCGSVYSW